MKKTFLSVLIIIFIFLVSVGIYLQFFKHNTANSASFNSISKQYSPSDVVFPQIKQALLQKDSEGQIKSLSFDSQIGYWNVYIYSPISHESGNFWWKDNTLMPVEHVQALSPEVEDIVKSRASLTDLSQIISSSDAIHIAKENGFDVEKNYFIITLKPEVEDSLDLLYWKVWERKEVGSDEGESGYITIGEYIINAKTGELVKTE